MAYTVVLMMGFNSCKCLPYITIRCLLYAQVKVLGFEAFVFHPDVTVTLWLFTFALKSAYGACAIVFKTQDKEGFFRANSWLHHDFYVTNNNRPREDFFASFHRVLKVEP